MTISEKQLKANQENAKLGGVKTNEGREAVKYNAIKHGLLTKEIFISGEDKEEFDHLVFSVVDELSPEGELDKFLVERIIANMWRLKRFLSVERKAIEYSKNDREELVLFDDEEQKNRKKEIKIIDSDFIDKILRYEVSIERSLYRAIREYKNSKNGFV